MRHVLLILTTAAGCLLAAAARASYLEGDEAAGTTAPPVRVIPRPVPRPAPPLPDNPLTRAIRFLNVRPGYTYDGLTVFQVETSRVADGRDYVSLGEALAGGDLAIEEKGAGSVPSLRARNTGRDHVLLLAGEIVAGGKQNRVLQYDVLLGPRGKWVELPVFCVEQGRWRGRAEFEGSPYVAARSIRADAQTGAAQEQIWAGVERYRSDLGVASPSDDLVEVQESPELQEALKRYREEFGERWRPEAVGMVVARWGRIVGADVFCNAEVFLKHRDRLLESYAADCWTWRRGQARLPDGPVVAADPRQAERFLRRALRASYRELPAPGAGQRFRVDGNGLRGSGMVWHDVLLHVALFPEPERIVLPADRPPVRPLPLPQTPPRREPQEGPRR